MSRSLVHQFRIALLEVEPTVWRRIQTPARYSFWDLHVAIQDSMGWLDYHLHAFRIRKPRGRKVWEIGSPDDDYRDATLPGWKTPVSDYLTEPGATAEYEYDFGDRWAHEVLLEGVLLAEPGRNYPRCLEGERACPPEDCGGPTGYADLLRIVKDPAYEERDEYLAWLSGQAPENQPFDPERFDAKAVRFDDPYELRSPRAERDDRLNG